MRFPKVLARITQHTPPRHQIYQPGFNPTNSCWLTGDWITVPKEGWGKRRRAHLALYKGIHQEEKAQSHRGEPISPEKMTPAQRQAWEFRAGSVTLHCQHSNGEWGGISVDLAGNTLPDGVVKKLRGQHRFPRYVQEPDGSILDQTTLVEIPGDLLLKDLGTTPETAVFVWKEIVRQNEENEEQVFESYLEGAEETPAFVEEGDEENFAGFALGMAIHALLQAEESIIRNEVDAARGKKNPMVEPAEDIARYVRMRAKAKKALGERFQQIYDLVKKPHNECEKANRDNGLFAYVLPEFNDDGTHAPWTADDVPKHGAP